MARPMVLWAVVLNGEFLEAFCGKVSAEFYVKEEEIDASVIKLIESR